MLLLAMAPAGTTSCRSAPASDVTSAESELERLEERCAAESGAACNDLGERYARGQGTAVDAERAIARFHRGCELGHVTACSYLGAFMGAGHGMPKNVPWGIELLGRGCDGGVPFACGALGRLLIQEFQRAREAEARAAFERGCALGHQSSCSDLEAVLTYPPIPEPDPDDASP